MYLTTVIAPFLFFLGAAILYRSLRVFSLATMTAGFFLVTLSVLLPFLFPIGADITPSTLRIMQFVGYIGSAGSLISVFGFMWFVFDVSKKNILLEK